MKIAMIAPTEIPARRANTLQVMKMAQAFCELDHDVTVISPTQRPFAMQKPTWQELARHYGLQVEFALEWLAARPVLRRYDFSLHALRRARALQADLVYTRLPQAAAIASWQGIPTILEIHDFPQGRIGPLLFRLFLSGRGACRLVIITHALAQDLVSQFRLPPEPEFTHIEPDGVDITRYQDLPAPADARRQLTAMAQAAGKETLQGLEMLAGARFTAGYTGHLYPGRGGELLVELSAALPQITFLIVGGEAQDIHRLQQAAQKRNLANIIFTGFVPNAELPLYQAACDVLLMPYQEHISASSGGDIARYLSPMKLFEYLACKRPILSSDIPVLRETLNENNALLLPPDKIEAWAGALQLLQNDPDKREQLAAQAGQDAQKYTWRARAARILEGKM